MVESGRLPRGGVVAGVACLREPGRHMVRICRFGEVGHVAAGALRRERREVIVHVAQSALHLDVRAGQRESGLGVIEDGVQPVSGRVADLAVRWETCRDVIRIGRLLEVRHMAARARQGPVLEVAIDVAECARRCHVRSGQGERGLRVVEGRRLPDRSGVAERTICREARRHVIRAVSLLEVCHMAAGALRRDRSEIVVQVALRALHLYVRAGQREHRLRVVERRGRPGRGHVADFAGCRNPRSRVVRSIGLLEIRYVATGALRRRGGEVAADVAQLALHRGMRAGQREWRLRVIERGWLPGCSRMAESAILRVARSDVVRAVRLLEVGEVAADASDRCVGELAADVAGRTGHRHVSAR